MSAGGRDVVERFVASAGADPSGLAVVGPGGPLSLGELVAAVEGMAGWLVERGVGRGSLVGVGLGRGVDQVVAVLGVLWVGGVYVPLDPAYPADRLAFMVADAGLDLILVDGDAPSWAGEVPASRIGRGDRIGAVRAIADDPAYVIYTSGSTGRPKGVVVSRGSLAHLLASLEAAGVFPAERGVVGWNASISFDASVQQWLRVCRGDTLVVVPEELRVEPVRLGEYLRGHGVTDLDVTPSHWAVLADAVAPASDGTPLRLLIGGEALPSAMWDRLAVAASEGRVAAVNVYGPTETTVDATAAWVVGDGPHIGAGLPGVGVRVLDERLRPVGTGEVGELYLGGAGVAMGYLNRSVLTAERFVPDMDSAGGGARMYRTGDVVRRRADGFLDYLGRSDRQVKVSGLRVELGELEAAVQSHPGVGSAVVLTRGDGVLVAWYTGRDGEPPAPEEVRDAVRGRLPAALVPAAFVPLAVLPRTPNGKLDTDALPTPDPTEAEADLLDAEPTGPIESLIAQAWQEVLGRDRVLATDDFFVLGGHSLMALKVVATLRRQLGMTVPTTLVYRHPRLRDLATRLASTQPG